MCYFDLNVTINHIAVTLSFNMMIRFNEKDMCYFDLNVTINYIAVTLSFNIKYIP